MRYPGFIDGTYTVDDVMAGNERTLNLFPEIYENQKGKNAVHLLGTPGLDLLRDVGNGGPIRGISWPIATIGEKYYFMVASGTKLYWVEYNGQSQIEIGTIADDANHTPVDFAYHDGNWLIVSAGTAYTLTGPSTVAAISDLSSLAGSLRGAVYLDGYFITCNGGSFFISELEDPTTWDLTQFGTPTGGCAYLKEVNGELWTQGGLATEVQYDAGSANFPFQRLPGSRVSQGARYPYSMAIVNNSVVWVGLDDNGGGVVWQSVNFVPKRISNHGVEKRLNDYWDTTTEITKVFAWTYREKGHEFYCLNLDAVITLVYDSNTGRWHERAYVSGGSEYAHLCRCHSFVSNTHMAGSRVDGKIYVLSKNLYDDDGVPILRLRRAPHLNEEGKNFQYNNFQLDLDVGTASTEADPDLVYMRYSDDGGKTFTTATGKPMGTTSNKKTRVRWNRLGSSRDRVFEVYSYAAIRHCWTDAFLNNRSDK